MGFFGKELPHVITPIISEGLARCSSDIGRLTLAVLFLYATAGCASGLLTHVMALAVAGERRGFPAVFAAELLLVPLYLAATKVRALRTNQWRLVRGPKPQGPEWRLFDPNRDPLGEHDLAERPDALESMKQKIAPFLAPDRAILDQTPEQMRVREIKQK